MSNTFEGNFGSNRQDDSVPHLLKYMVSMIVNGLQPSTKTSKNLQQSQVVRMISQLLDFNTKKKETISNHQRHSSERDTPSPIYISLKVHLETGKKGLVETLFWAWNLVQANSPLYFYLHSKQHIYMRCKRFETEGVVAPPGMKNCSFTVGAVDNIDLNPT